MNEDIGGGLGEGQRGKEVIYGDTYSVTSLSIAEKGLFQLWNGRCGSATNIHALICRSRHGIFSPSGSTLHCELFHHPIYTMIHASQPAFLYKS
jgi:hypothetical protein